MFYIFWLVKQWIVFDNYFLKYFLFSKTKKKKKNLDSILIAIFKNFNKKKESTIDNQETENSFLLLKIFSYFKFF